MSRKFFALENADLSMGDEGQLNTGDVQELADGVQETSVDAAEVDEVANAIEDAEVAADNLEESADILEQGVESGEGVSEETAQAVEVAVESALNMLGASHRQRSLLPSLESWGAGQSRLSSTKFALESVTDKIKEIWKKIVEFVKMIAQKVVDFFAKFFDNTDRLKKNAAKMRAKVNEAGSNAKAEGTIKNGTVTNGFNNGEGKSDFSTAMEILKNQAELAKASVGQINALSGGLNAVQALMKDTNAGPSVNKALEGIAGAIGNSAGSKPYTDDEKQRNGVRTGALLGGVHIVVGIESGKEVNNADGSSSIPTSVYFETEEPAKKSTKEAAILSPKEALDMLTAVEDLAKATEEYKKVKSSVENLTKQTAKLADAAVQAADENGSMAGARKLVSSIARTSSRMATMLPAMNVRAGNVALSYIQSSISGWKKDGK